MSLFGGRPAQAPPSVAMNERIEAAAMEVEMVSDLFNRMVRTCHEKCVGQRYHEPTLNKGESVCVDRCVAKYFAANDVVGKVMQSQNEQAAQQQASASSGGGGIGSLFGR